MNIALKKVKEGSNEAKILELAVKFYDYYSDVSEKQTYWDEVYQMANRTIAKFTGDDKAIATKAMLAAMDLLETKLKNSKEKIDG